MRRAVFILLAVCLVLCFIDALALDYSQDVRAMNYYNDYNLYAARDLDGNCYTFGDLDGNCYTFASGIDEIDAGNINPVLVPFDVLDKTDNPGIRLQ